MGELAAAVIDRLGVGSRVVDSFGAVRVTFRARGRILAPRLAHPSGNRGEGPTGWGTGRHRPISAVPCRAPWRPKLAPAATTDGFPAIWAPEHVDLTPELITEAHALGLDVLPWTVNGTADMTRLIDGGSTV